MIDIKRLDTCAAMIYPLQFLFTFTEWGFTMFSIADLLERARAKGGIESDYRLAKIISVNPSAIYNYRAWLSYPNDKILAKLCALSGDDVAVMAAHVQAARAQSSEGKTMWEAIAARLILRYA